MNVRITPHRFTGSVRVPASKSHTIRQLLIAALANGETEIVAPLDSLDTRSCVDVCKAFGADVIEQSSIEQSSTGTSEKLTRWIVRGNNNFKDCAQGKNLCGQPIKVDVGNSGTTLFFALAIAGLQSRPVIFTGDEQIQKRSAAPLLDALTGLGVEAQSKNGCAPITIKGTWKGGKVTLPCPTSQYLSALLIAAPLAPAGTITEIDIPLLNEKPYIDMTLSYLKAQGIQFEAPPDYSHFVIHGGASFCGKRQSFVPADFSSAVFPAAAAAITGGEATLLGLDPQDTQGDKFFFKMLESMGCEVQWKEEVSNSGKKSRTLALSRKGPLCGGSFDLNETPDLLPAAAALAAFAKGDTKLYNVAHARIKETDRITVMAQELAKLGVSCTELPDGLIVHGKGALSPTAPNPIIEGHGDHRIVMAFSVAALGSPTPIEITTAESAAVTYPNFFSIIK